MQTLESLGVPASAFLIPHSMPEAPNNGQQGWVHPQQQGGFPTHMDQGAPINPNAHPNHIFVMNSVKPEQPIQRREEVISSPPPPNPSVITATYNPTYNRCLPKILSDLDCEMKIKQVLRCIENILLETGDVDLQQQAYKLPDRSLSPQFAKTKKPKFKEDEEMLQSPNINLPLATNSPASLINKAANKSSNNIKINVKVEPDMEQKAPPGVRPAFNEPTGSPRGQMFDFSYKQSPAHPGQPQQAFPQQPQRHMYEGFPNSPHAPQPMIPHIQLSMSSPHLNHSAANSPHMHHHTSSPHIHTGSPHLVHSPHQHTHTNSPHVAHSPLPHSPLGQTQTPSPHLSSNGVLSPPQSIPIQQFQVLTRPEGPESGHHSSDNLMQQDYHYQQMEGVQAGGFKGENPQLQQQQAQQKKEPIDFVLDPSLFAQYLAQNQQQLAQLQQQLHQQQIQHSQLQQQRFQLQQQQSHQSPQQQPSPQQASNNAHPSTTTTTASSQAPPQVPAHLQHLFDPTHPINLSGHHPMSLSGHLMQQLNPDGTISLQEDDKWILSLLNMDSSIAHDLSLSGHIPPM
eukprot:Phypoly_transcript_05474.p1 GENE.Phypoly_transcript_05474~~Phypoly_transcript_05474.p1  ORF type:complete len:568 (+),score=145.51 Phypoly_transcript_05474:99-1802(+)